MGVQTPHLLGQPFPTTDLTPLDSYVGAFSGIVVNEAWSQLEPQQGVYDWTPLNASLAAVSSWNSEHPTAPLGVKLRIFGGLSAPIWLMTESGGVTIDIHGSLVQLGRWWTPIYESAWSNFQHALAAQYDSDSLVRQVSVSSCTSSTGEPFVVSGSKVSQMNLEAAGWSPAIQAQCLSHALSDYSGWKETPVTFAFNPLPSPSGPSAVVMQNVMQACASSASTGGPVCIVGNNDLSSGMADTKYGLLVGDAIDHIESGVNPPTVYFQTVGAPLSCQSIATGLSYHARSIELWSPNGRYQGFDIQTPSTLKIWNQALIQGATTLTC
jgi:hypothetical protein